MRNTWFTASSLHSHCAVLLPLRHCWELKKKKAGGVHPLPSQGLQHSLLPGSSGLWAQPETIPRSTWRIGGTLCWACAHPTELLGQLVLQRLPSSHAVGAVLPACLVLPAWSCPPCLPSLPASAMCYVQGQSKALASAG